MGCVCVCVERVVGYDGVEVSVAAAAADEKVCVTQMGESDAWERKLWRK